MSGSTGSTATRRAGPTPNEWEFYVWCPSSIDLRYAGNVTPLAGKFIGAFNGERGKVAKQFDSSDEAKEYVEARYIDEQLRLG